MEKRSDVMESIFRFLPKRKIKSKKTIHEHAPEMKAGKFARTALFYYLHMIDKHGPHAVISEILGA